jgi:hypothetical protein
MRKRNECLIRSKESPATKEVFPSPLGGRCPEGADEGDVKYFFSPSPLPGGEGKYLTGTEKKDRGNGVYD